MVTYKIDGVSKLSNVEFTKEGRVWRAYGVGPGKLISAPKSQIPSADTLPSLEVLQAHPSSFSSTVKGRATTAYLGDKRATGDQAETDEEPSTSNEALFTCPDIPEALLHDATLGLWQTSACSRAGDAF